MSEEQSELTAVEQRLVGLLMLLSEETRRSDSALTTRVMRAVRVQFLARGAVRAIGDLAGALADGLALVFGLRARAWRR